MAIQISFTLEELDALISAISNERERANHNPAAPIPHCRTLGSLHERLIEAYDQLSDETMTSATRQSSIGLIDSLLASIQTLRQPVAPNNGYDPAFVRLATALTICIPADPDRVALLQDYLHDMAGEHDVPISEAMEWVYNQVTSGFYPEDLHDRLQISKPF